MMRLRISVLLPSLLATAVPLLFAPEVSASVISVDTAYVSTFTALGAAGINLSSYVYMASGSSLTLQGAGGYITMASSMTASAFFGDASHLKNAVRNLIVNVKDYGATGDGATDDTAAISAATAAVASLGGGTIFFPPGTYNFTGISITTNNIRLAGVSYGWSEAEAPARLNYTGNRAAVVISSSAHAQNFSMENIDVSGTSNATDGILFTSTNPASGNDDWCTQCLLYRVSVHGFTRPGAAGVDHAEGVHNVFRQVSSFNNDIGIRIVSGHSTALHLNEISCRSNATYGILIDSGVQSVSIDGQSILESNGGPGIRINASNLQTNAGISVRDSFIASNLTANGTYQFEIGSIASDGSDSRNILIDHVYFGSDGGQGDIYVSSASRVVIANNNGGAAVGQHIVKIDSSAQRVYLANNVTNSGGDIDPDNRASLNISDTGSILGQSSVTASAFFGDGSHLTGIIPGLAGSSTTTSGFPSYSTAQSSLSVCASTVTITTTGNRVAVFFSGGLDMSGFSAANVIFKAGILQDGAYVPPWDAGHGIVAFTGPGGGQNYALMPFYAILPAPSGGNHSYCINLANDSGRMLIFDVTLSKPQFGAYEIK